LFVEIRFHGRGGQGVVSASRILAESALIKGLYIQAFPEFGAERAGAPIAAYTRISDTPIEIHSFIYQPDIVMVVDRSMVFYPIIKEGLKEDSTVIVNFSGEPQEVRKGLGLGERVRVAAVDATKIALETIGRDIPNTPLLGTFARIFDIVDLDSVVKALADRFKGPVLEKNIEALKRGYEEAKVG
jgi:pyruvate ferredoxin oxidoreductase gamma subunit